MKSSAAADGENCESLIFINLLVVVIIETEIPGYCSGNPTLSSYMASAVPECLNDCSCLIYKGYVVFVGNGLASVQCFTMRQSVKK